MKGHALLPYLSSLFCAALVLPSISIAADLPQNQPSASGTSQDQTTDNSKATGTVKLPQSGGTLSNKLETSGGAIKPPPTNDTQMVEPPPKTHDPMAIKPGSSDQVPSGTPTPVPK